MRYEEIII